MLASTSEDSKPMARHPAEAHSTDSAAMSHLTTRNACIRLDLKLEPPELERDFWRSVQTRRALQLADTIACVLALVHVLSVLKKFFQMQSSTATAQDYPTAFKYYYTASNLAYSVTAGLPLLLMVLRPAAYHQHRYRLAVASRLLRAVNSTVVLYASIAAAAIARSLAARIFTYRPHIALMFIALQPAVFFAQQSMFILSWRWAVPLQLLNFRASLFWSARIPCVLALQPGAAATNLAAEAVGSAGTWAGGSNTTHGSASQPSSGTFFQSEATGVCQVMHYLFSLLGSLTGDLHGTAWADSTRSSCYSSFSSESCSSSFAANASSSSGLPALQPAPAVTLCDGHSAVQVLQVTVSLFLFLIVPLGTIYWWEYTWKCSHLKNRNVSFIQPGEWLWGPVVDALSSSGSSRGMVHSGTTTSDPDNCNPNGDIIGNGVVNGTNSMSAIADASALHGVYRIDVSQQKWCFVSSLCVVSTVPVLVLYAAWSLATVIVQYLPPGGDCAGMF